ncbi:MAG: hypothetical protein HY864_07215 [Chloroflexi bacterium]|nr:hypothetical protein [Chloroflexota bacterium]
MFRRGRQRMMRGAGVPGIPPMLQRANQLMVDGDFVGAAEAFQQLAQGAEARFPQRAPFLFMEAGRAAILSGQTKAGVAHLRRGLTLLEAQGRIPRMQAFGQRAVSELKARGLTAEAEEIAALIQVPASHETPTEPVAAKRPILPTHCPSCGGAVRPDEVEWLDDITAECAYCGSPVRE